MSTSPAARIAVEVDGARACATELTASAYLRPRLLGVDGPRVRIALVGICATLLAGDALRLEIDIEPGAHVELVEPSGMVAYDGRGRSASWTATAAVRRNASLVWAAAPFVVADGADVRRHTGIHLDRDAVMLFRETLVLGRSDEAGGRLRSGVHALHDERPLLVEDLDLRDPASRSAPGVLGANRVVATTALLGTRPHRPPAGHETELAGAGAVARAITTHAHLAESALSPTWYEWRDLAYDQ